MTRGSGIATNAVSSVAGKTGAVTLAAGDVSGVETPAGSQAKADAAAAFAVQRANHTGTQAISTVTGLQSALDGAETPAGSQAKADAASAFAVQRANHTGTQAISTVTGLQSALNSAETPAGSQAKADAASAFAVQRANHTGTQAISTVTGLQSALDAKVAKVEMPLLVWNAGDQICIPISSSAASATLTATSGQPLLTGGPGMVVPAGTQVQGITFVSNAAAAGLTHCFAFIAIPDETGLAQATVVAVSQDFLTAAWGTNTAKKFSFRAADGGSGFWTPAASTPVYGGLVQVGTTPATLRGMTGSAQIGPVMTPKWFASSSTGVTTPATLATVLGLNDTASAPFCRLSNVYN
jgi:hypothetical protein